MPVRGNLFLYRKKHGLKTPELLNTDLSLSSSKSSTSSLSAHSARRKRSKSIGIKSNMKPIEDKSSPKKKTKGFSQESEDSDSAEFQSIKKSRSKTRYGMAQETSESPSRERLKQEDSDANEETSAPTKADGHHEQQTEVSEGKPDREELSDVEEKDEANEEKVAESEPKTFFVLI